MELESSNISGTAKPKRNQRKWFPICTYYSKEGAIRFNLFDTYKSVYFNIWCLFLSNNPEEWRASTCTCPFFLKNQICKHVIGMSIRLKYYKPPREAKNVEIGTKRERGQPSKARKALLLQQCINCSFLSLSLSNVEIKIGVFLFLITKKAFSVIPKGLKCETRSVSVTVCDVFTACRSGSVMLWASIDHHLCFIYYVSVTVCYALDPCRSRSVWGGGSKFSTLNFNTLFQIVFHKIGKNC